MAVALSCSGTLSTGTGGEPICSTAWEYVVVGEYMTITDFNDLWPYILLTFAIAWGVKWVRAMFEERPGRG